MHPLVLRKHIKVSDDVYSELQKLKGELGVESPNQVIRKLIEYYRKGAPLGQGVLSASLKTGYYVVHECGTLAHLVMDGWFYCPKCNQLFQAKK